MNFEDSETDDPDDPASWKLDFVLTEGEDAMSRMGYGVVSYFGLIHTFMMVFFLITCVNIPIMINNSQWKAFASMEYITWTA